MSPDEYGPDSGLPRWIAVLVVLSAMVGLWSTIRFFGYEHSTIHYPGYDPPAESGVSWEAQSGGRIDGESTGNLHLRRDRNHR